MRPLIFVSVVFASFVSFVGGQSCPTPNGVTGTCIGIYDCKPLAAILNNDARTQADLDLLKKSQCGFKGTTPAVCCPPDNNRSQQNNCFTPEGNAGQCVDIYQCKHISDLLTPPVSQANINTIQSLQCPGPSEYSVCCGPPPTNQNNVQASCNTPDGNRGRCIDIYQCAHMAALLNPPVTQQSINLIQNSQCPGPTQYSVCCGPPPITPFKAPNPKICKDTVSAYPPDPSSGCCGVDSVAGNKIVGGTETRIDQYPWLVLINYYKDGVEVPKLLCGGALISGRYVLTAAHCLASQRGTARMVTLGEYDTSNEGRDCTQVEAEGEDCTDPIIKIPIESSLSHPEYSPNNAQRNDIALLRLRRMAPFTDFIRPICLPPLDLTLNPPPNFTLYGAGWGAVNPRQSTSPVKLHVPLPFINLQQCQATYTPPGRTPFLWNKQLCAGGVQDQDTCRGDSGGPLMYENGRIYEAIGVVSFGPKICGSANIPAVYTKVFEYKDWIMSNIKP